MLSWLRTVWKLLWGRVLFETFVILLLEILYVTFQYHPQAKEDLIRHLSDALFLLSLVLFIASLLYVIRFFGWRRRNYLPAISLFRFFRGRTLSSPKMNEEGIAEDVSEELARKDRQAIAAGVKRDPSLLISSIILLLISIAINWL